MAHQERPEAWVKLPSDAEAHAAVGGETLPYETLMGGVVLRITRLILAHRLLGKALLNHIKVVMFGPGALSRAEREMVAAVTSAAQNCHYFTYHHTEFLRVEGGDPALAEAIRHHRWREVVELTERQRALCMLAEKLSSTPTRMVREDWQPLRHLDFDDRACLEVAHIVCLFNYLIRLAEGFGLQPTEAKSTYEQVTVS